MTGMARPCAGPAGGKWVAEKVPVWISVHKSVVPDLQERSGQDKFGAVRTCWCCLCQGRRDGDRRTSNAGGRRGHPGTAQEAEGTQIPAGDQNRPEIMKPNK